MTTKSAATLAKGLALLRAIVVNSGRSGLGAIARECGIPISTAHRLAMTLEAEGFLVRGFRGHYLAGPAMRVESGNRSDTALAAQRLRRPLARLATANEAFAHFGVLEDGMVTYLVKEKGGKADLFTAEAMQLEAYCSAIGKIVLAGMPDAELDAYLAGGPFVAMTERTLTDPDAIRQELIEARKSGVAYDRREIRDDLFCIAVPVRGVDGVLLGGVSLSFLDRIPGQDERQMIIRQLRAIARRSSRSGKAAAAD